jgi:HEAT repeat protein
MSATWPISPLEQFTQRFGDLVALLRADPTNDAAQDLALETCTAIANSQPIRLESGVEVVGDEQPLSLKGRLLARQVDIIGISPGVEEEELLRLARALAHDTAPIVSSPHVTALLIESVVPNWNGLTLLDGGAETFSPPRDGGDRRLHADRRDVLRGVRYRGQERRRTERRVTGERRLVLVKHVASDVQKVHERLGRAIKEADWRAALHLASVQLQTLPAVPYEDRRRQAILLKRQLTPASYNGIVRLALSDPLEAAPAAALLRWGGLDAAEVMLRVLMEAESVGPRRILFEVLGGMPEIYPIVLPYLLGGSTHEVRHAAELAGRLRNPAAIDPLKRRLNDLDERVRAAVIQALAEFPLGEVVESMRIALASASPSTRFAAVDAIGRRRALGFAMPLLTLLEHERDPQVWKGAVRSLALLGTPDALTGLARLALAKRSFLTGKGCTAEQRIEIVRTLAQQRGQGVRGTLERIARETGEPVRTEALRALQEPMSAAG